MRQIVLPVRVLVLSSLFMLSGLASAQQCDPVSGADCEPEGFPFPGTSGLRDPATANSFSLSPPGARSLAMGGAFLGLADDATAAYTNPAGLTNLSVGGAEIAVEMRGAEFRSSYVDRGHYNSDLVTPAEMTFSGQDFEDELVRGEADGNSTGLSFVSYGFVLPGGLTMALYRHELGNFESGFQAQGPFNDDFCDGIVDPVSERDCRLFRVLPSRSKIDMDIVNYGVSAAQAFDVGSASSLSVGLGISYYDAQIDREAATYDICRFDQFDPLELEDPMDPNSEPLSPCTRNETRSRLPGGFFGPADFSPDNLQSIDLEEGKDQAFGVNLGFLLKIGRERRFSVGGVFRQGVDFDTLQRSFFSDDEFDEIVFIESPGTLSVPDVFGLGIAYRTAEGKTKFVFDWNRIRYSQTLPDFVSALAPGEADDFEVDDIDQFHFGMERIVLVVESLFVGSARFGIWSEPDHIPRYIGPNPDVAALFSRESQDEIHVSLGFGLVIKEDYQLDFAANFADTDDVVSFSLVKFF